MKRILAISVILALAITTLCACTGASATAGEKTSSTTSISETEVITETQTTVVSEQTEESSQAQITDSNTTVKQTGPTAATTKIAGATTVSNTSTITTTSGTASVYPFSQLNHAQTGVSIPFAIGVGKNIMCSNKDNYINIVTSVSQLKSIQANDDNINGIDYTSKYSDESFFADKALVVIFITETSGSFRHTFDLVKNGPTLCANIKRYLPGVAEGEIGIVTDDMAPWRYLLEVNRSDIADVTSLAYFLS